MAKSQAHRIKIENLLNPMKVPLGSPVPTQPRLEPSGPAQNRSLSTSRKSQKRQTWSEQEDQLLRELVLRNGPSQWTKLAEQFEGRRVASQLRARWTYALCDELDKRPFTPQEDAALLRAHARLGNKWAQVAEELEHRVANSVKNRFYVLQRKSRHEQLVGESSDR
mmetsp:Transcript_2935/g.8070  ORF Transcript_2935/g.8070 Transcript_2935/m.8070 type:complete len:166 (-) Transcript_2935:385-882(-)